MKKIVPKIFWILTSLLLIISGGVCIFNPGIMLSSISILLGFSLIISGISDIIAYFDVHHDVPGSGWVLAEGIFTILFGIICLFHQMITVITIPLIFTIWVLFTGVSRIVSSLDYKMFGFSHWWVVFLFGIFLILLGICAMLKPIIAAFAVSAILGVLLISVGVGSLIKGFYVNQVIKKFENMLK